jgi:hypothetical protein
MALFSTVFSALVRKGFLVGGGLFLLLLLLEGALWKWSPAPPETVYRYQLTNTLEDRGLSREVDFGIDSRQLRALPGDRGRSKSCQTLVLGGAFLYEPLQQVDGTWWGQLSQSLEQAHTELAFPIASRASSPGMTQQFGVAMRDGIQWARKYVPELQPDVVIAVFGVSEVLDVVEGFTIQQPETAPIRLKANNWKDQLSDVSQLVRRLRQERQLRSPSYSERKAVLEKVDHFVKTDERQRVLYESLPFDGQPPVRQGSANDPLLEYLASLKALKSILDSVGAQLVVLGEPSLHEAFLGSTEEEERTFRRPRWRQYPSELGAGVGYRPDPAWVERELTRYYAEASKWCKTAGVPFLNLNDKSVLPKTLEHFFNDSMLTNLGSKLVASKVQPVLAPVVKKFLAN